MNICWNRLSIRGDHATVDAVTAAVLTEPEEPYPFDVRRLSVDDFESDCEVDLAWPGALELGFGSAGGPPLAVLVALIRAFPELSITLRYSEPGDALYGLVTAAAGAIVRHVTLDEDEDEDEQRRKLVSYPAFSAYLARELAQLKAFASVLGPTGTVYGLDMTDEMLALAQRNASEAGVTNVHF